MGFFWRRPIQRNLTHKLQWELDQKRTSPTHNWARDHHRSQEGILHKWNLESTRGPQQLNQKQDSPQQLMILNALETKKFLSPFKKTLHMSKTKCKINLTLFNPQICSRDFVNLKMVRYRLGKTIFLKNRKIICSISHRKSGNGNKVGPKWTLLIVTELTLT